MENQYGTSMENLNRKTFTLAAFALKFHANGVGYTDQENKTKHGNS